MGSADISALSFYCLRLWLCILHPMVCNQMADTLILTYRKFLLYFWAPGLILVRTMSRVSHISRRLSLSALFHVYQCFCANCESALQVLNLIMIFLQLSFPLPVFDPAQSCHKLKTSRIQSPLSHTLSY